jgi:hypothetical protein
MTHTNTMKNIIKKIFTRGRKPVLNNQRPQIDKEKPQLDNQRPPAK